MIFVFCQKYGENISKNIKNVNSKYNQKFLYHAKLSAADVLKTTSKRAIQKTAEATSDLIDIKTDDKITKVSKSSLLNSLKTVDRLIPKERYLSPEKKKQSINDLRLI